MPGVIRLQADMYMHLGGQALCGGGKLVRQRVCLNVKESLDFIHRYMGMYFMSYGIRKASNILCIQAPSKNIAFLCQE